MADWNREDLPDIHTLESDVLQVLWILDAARLFGRAPLTAAQISDILLNDFSIGVSRQRVAAILREDRTMITRVGRGTPAIYRILKKGSDVFAASQEQAIFVDPSKALTSIRRAEGIFSDQSGKIKIADTYVDGKTLDYLVQTKEIVKFSYLPRIYRT